MNTGRNSPCMTNNGYSKKHGIPLPMQGLAYAVHNFTHVTYLVAVYKLSWEIVLHEYSMHGGVALEVLVNLQH